MRVKICGITRPQDAAAADAAGADAIGIVFARSRRRVVESTARRIIAATGPFTTVVGVFRDQPLAEVLHLVTGLGLDVAQLHGSEDAEYASAVREHALVIRAVRFSDATDPQALDGYPADAFMLDAANPGSGISFDWDAASAWRGHPRLVLAGGLTPENVGAAVSTLSPYGVDVSTGVERGVPGIKDPELIAAFVRSARG